MTLEEARMVFAAKREQLIIYRDSLMDDGAATQHARTMTNGRIAQIEQDLHTLEQVSV